MDEWIRLAVASILGGLLGGGVIAGLFYRALKDRLLEDLGKVYVKQDRLVDEVDKVFSRRKELDGMSQSLGDKVEGVKTLTIRMDDRVAKNENDIIRLQEENRHAVQPMREFMERLSDRQQAQQEQLVRTAALLDAVERRLKEHERRKGG